MPPFPWTRKWSFCKRIPRRNTTATRSPFAATEGRLYGFLSVPVKPGKYPAVVATHGTGCGYSEATIIPGSVCLVLNTLKYDPRTPGKTIEQLYEEVNKPLFHLSTGGYNRKTYFFYRPILAMVRAVNWLAEQPFINPAAIGYDGSSQGVASDTTLRE